MWWRSSMRRAELFDVGCVLGVLWASSDREQSDFSGHVSKGGEACYTERMSLTL